MSLVSAPEARFVPTDRLFFGVFPDSESATKLAAFAEALNTRYALRGVPFPADRLVVTLAAVGRYQGLSEQAITAACEVAARVVYPAFEVAFNLMDRFGGGAYALHYHDTQEALGTLCQTLDRALMADFPQPRRRMHTPHMTVLKAKGLRTPPRRVAPIAWQAREIVLVHKVRGHPELRKLAQWTLTQP